MNTKVIDVHTFKKEDIGLMLQIIFTIILIVITILDAFDIISSIFTYLTMGLLMFVMAFNNKYTYKKKHMTKIYITTGILIIICTIIEVL